MFGCVLYLSSFLAIVLSTEVPTTQPTQSVTIGLPPTQEAHSYSYNKQIQTRIEEYAVIGSAIGVIFLISVTVHCILRYQLISSVYLLENDANQLDNVQIQLKDSIAWKRSHLTLGELEYENMMVEMESDVYGFNVMKRMEEYYRQISGQEFLYQQGNNHEPGNEFGDYEGQQGNEGVTHENEIDDSESESESGGEGYNEQNHQQQNLIRESSSVNEYDMEIQESFQESFEGRGSKGQHTVPNSSQVVIGTQINSI